MYQALIDAAEHWRQEIGTNTAQRPEPLPRSTWMTASRAADVLGISTRAVRKAGQGSPGEGRAGQGR